MFLSLCLFMMSSCTINRNVMFKTDQDFVFDTPDSINAEYVIAPNDILMIRVFSNNGALLINTTASDQNTGQRNLQNQVISYTVQPDGKVKLPEVGEIELAGKTIIEAQMALEDEYDTYHVDSYALVSVLNNRIVVFPGSGGDALVITLTNNNVSVIEALALAGGITDRGDASKVKLIRKQGTAEEKIFHMDLSTIEGIQYAEMDRSGQRYHLC